MVELYTDMQQINDTNYSEVLKQIQIGDHISN